MVFEHDFETGLSDITNDKTIKNKAILRIFEDIAAKHSDSIKNGLYDIIDNGFSWVLLEWRLKVEKRPRYGDILQACTWVRNSTKLYSYRDFEICVNGERAVCGSSKWICVDIKTLRPVKLSDELLGKYCPEPDKNVFGAPEFEKMKEQGEYSVSAPFAVRKSDIDINGHIHNLNYTDMVCEIFDFEKEPDYAAVLYKKEIKYGDNVTVSGKQSENGYFVKIHGENGVNALIEMR
ncbi:MAG: hypothetical protein IJR59_03265 [Firmicutes bacterium]|nr:hypothetical protein [Bacillota bacterium]